MASFSHKNQLEELEVEAILFAFEKLHPLLIACDLELRLLWMSSACNDLVGSSSEWIGRDLEEFLGCLCEQPDLQRIKDQCAEFEGALATNEDSFDFRFDLAETLGRPFGVNLAALREGQEGPRRRAILVLQPDDSERNINSMASCSESALNAVLETFPDPAFAIDARGLISFANGPATTVFTPEAGSLAGLASEAFRPYSPELADALASLLGGEDPSQREIQINHPSGKPLRVALSSQSLNTGANIGASHLIWLRDISNEGARHLDSERRNEELEQLIHSASHNLRSSLLPVLGFSQLLRKDFDHQLDETGRHYTDRIETSAQKMDALIGDLLDLSRIFVGEIRRIQIDSRALLSRLESDLKRKLDDAGVELKTPEICPALSGDANYLYQMFSHLVVNAVDHMGECEHRRIEISFEKQPQSDCDLLSVRDYGQGVPPEELEKIFEAFYSKATSLGGGKSRGLGLTFVRAIAEAHGGRAWAENPLQQGARLRVILPRG